MDIWDRVMTIKMASQMKLMQSFDISHLQFAKFHSPVTYQAQLDCVKIKLKGQTSVTLVEEKMMMMKTVFGFGTLSCNNMHTARLNSHQ